MVVGLYLTLRAECYRTLRLAVSGRDQVESETRTQVPTLCTHEGKGEKYEASR